MKNALSFLIEPLSNFTEANLSNSDPTESNLDLQYAMGLTAPQTITLLQVGDFPNGKSFSSCCCFLLYD